LSFQAGGVVKYLKVKEGDQVKAGQTLAVLDQDSLLASLTSARGALAQAQANYNKVAAGSSAEQIKVQEKAVAAAQVFYNNYLSQLAAARQTTGASISQARSALDDLLSLSASADNKRSAIAVTIAKQLILVKTNLDTESQILNDSDLKDTFSSGNSAALNNFIGAKLKVQPLLDLADDSLAAAQISKSDANLDRSINDAIDVLNQNIRALNYCFLALSNSIAGAKFSQSRLDTYKADINTALVDENSGISSIKSSRQALTDAITAAANSLTNEELSASQQINSIQGQINSAKAAWEQAEALLLQLKAKARPSDIDAAKADILSAQGQVASAQSAIADATLSAPADGTITSVDIKSGELAAAQKEVIVLQDVNNLHLEADISEANVAAVKPGQSVDVTFDALGPERHFTAAVRTINPASTVISGVVNFKITASLAKVGEIKPGMTANLIILTAEKNGVLAVPSRAIINQSGKQSVRLIDDPLKKTYHEAEVRTGLAADGGLTEIISGLKEGQEIVVYIKQ
ncbi:MAG: efflux RND transporter periplasmic adaptor subunit, partial [bacterium]|nr:efflux RND transporter periplasmic adaptor subunit [bacterium]